MIVFRRARVAAGIPSTPGTSLLAAAALALAAAPSAAHDTWILPRDVNVTEGRAASFDLTSGTSFPKLESPIKRDRIARGGWRGPNAAGDIDRRTEESSSLVIELSPSGRGTAVVFLSLGPKDIDLDTEEVAHYFDEIGAPEALRRAWAEAGGDAKFHETYHKHAKAYVRVGDAGEDPTCLRPAGFPLELIPQRDPTALAVGDSLVVKAVRGGDDEVESFAVGVVCGTTGQTEMRRTNQAGMVAFTIIDAGWWLVRATDLRRRADGTFESDFTTMTFYVEE